MPNLSKTNSADAMNWSYNDDLEMETDKDKPQPQGGEDKEEGGEGRVGVTHDDEMLETPLIQSTSATSPFGFNEAHFY